MKIKSYIIILIAALLVSVFDPVYGQNLIVNGDFSQDTVGWKSTSMLGNTVIVAQFGPVTDFGGSGPASNHACEIATYSTIRQTVAVQPNTVYAFQFKASRNTSFFTGAPPAATLVVTVQRNSTVFVNATNDYTQTSNPFSMVQENYFFTTGPATDSVVLDFGIPANYFYGDNVVVDDVSLVSTQACNGMPSAGTPVAAVSSVCPGSSFSINLTGYSLESGISFQWESSPAGQNNWSNTSGTGSNLVIPSQTAATDYRCKVTCANSNQTAISPLVSIGQNTPTNCYCTPTFINGCTNYYIDDVSIPGEAGTTINNVGTGCSAGGYDDRTGTDSVTFAENETYGINIDGPAYGSVKVWIDFDDDGIFTSSEAVGDNNLDLTFPTAFTITIPVAAQLGYHRMRIVTIPGGWIPAMGPCDLAYGGEAHDYTTLIVAPVSCSAPTGTTAPAVSLTTNSALLQWTQAGSAGQWQMEYASPDFAQGVITSIFTASSSYMLTGLSPNTDYEFRVRAVCGVGDTSNWSFPCSFTTSTTCFAPVEDAATNLTPTSAVLNWTQAGSASQWEIEYGQGIFGLGTGTRVPVFTNSYALTGLNPGTLYTYFIRTICGPGDTSSWIALNGLVSFSTPVSCVAPYIFGSFASNTTTASADLSWIQQGGGSLWEISYGTGTFTAASGTHVIAGSNPFTLIGLSPATSYRFYVRQICGPGDTSSWSNQSNQFSTLCAPFTPPYTQDFEAPVGSGFYPLCMYAQNTGHWVWSAFSSSLYPSMKPHQGSRYFMFFANSLDTLYTAGLDLVAGTPYYFNCYYITDGLAGWTDLSIIANTTQDPSGYEATLITITNPTDTVYQPLGGVFVPATTGTYYFGIACASAGGLHGLSIDDITVGTTPLAIKLAGFHAVNAGRDNRLDWSTISEAPGDMFSVEHSIDGHRFEVLEEVAATGTPGAYSYLHREPSPGLNYYRIKLKDAGGSYSYSRTIAVKTEAGIDEGPEVVPNPSAGDISMRLPHLQPNAQIVIRNIYGSVVMRFPATAANMHVEISRLPAGSYFLSYSAVPGKAIKIIKL